MILRLWTAFLLSGATVAVVAGIVLFLHEKNLCPVRELVGFFKTQPKSGRVFLGTFFLVMWIIASVKPGGGNMGGGDGGGDGGGTNNIQMVNGPGGGLQPLDSPGTETNPLNQGLPGEIQPTGGGALGDPSPVTDTLVAPVAETTALHVPSEYGNMRLR